MPLKPGPGRGHKYVPTVADRNTVKAMVAAGIPQDTICLCLGTGGISKPTLHEHFRAEIDTSAPRANAAVATKLYEAAMQGHGWAICFWLKTRGGFREVNRTELSGIDGAPMEVNTSGVELLKSRIDSIAQRKRTGGNIPGAD